MRTSRPVLIGAGVVLVLIGTFGSPTRAAAGFVFVSSQSSLGANDSVAWGSLGTLTSPNFSLTTAGGVQVNGQMSGLGSPDGVPRYFTYGITQSDLGQFGGATVLYAVENSPITVITSVSITFTFPEPVFGFGADLYASAGYGNFEIIAVDTNGNTQTLPVSGFGYSGFAGVRSDTPNLASLTYVASGGPLLSGPSGTFIQIGPASVVSPTVTTVPAPGGLPLAVSGSICLLGGAWLRRKRALA
jgi:hypothetical protein